MTATERLFLIGCLLQGALCQNWDSFLPPSVEVLTGSCVIIPCSFDIESQHNSDLDDPSCRAIWKRGTSEVFDSSVTGAANTIQGTLTGNLRQKNCTTILKNFPSYPRNAKYYFRLECDNALKYNFRHRHVQIKNRDSPSSPTLTPGRVEVKEGDPVSLSCSASAPCPSLPPTLTWTPRLGDSEKNLQDNHNNLVTSVLTFNASYLHHGQTISCTALYKRQDGNHDLSSEKTLRISVLYPPKNTSVSVSPSGPVLEGSSVTLTCNSDANPAVTSYNWYRVDEDLVTTVTHTQKQMTLISVAASQYFCQTRNDHGAQNSSIIELDVQYPPKNTSVSVSPSGPVLEGSSVTLTCSSDANPAVENYTWYRDNGTEGVAEHGQDFILDSADSSHSGEYYCEARNHHGVNKSPRALLDIQYPPKNTSVSVSPSGPVLEGSSVTLICSSDANPVVDNYTWYKSDGWKNNVVGSGQKVTIKVTKLSRERFYCKALNDHGVNHSEAISLDVTFAPEILSTTGCTRTTSQIRCHCESHGNPLPVLEWRLDGESVNQSADLVISEQLVESTGLASSLTVRQSLKRTPTVVCISTNSVTFDRMAFNVPSEVTPIWTEFLTVSFWIGVVIGALGLLLLCIPLQLILCKRRSSQLPNQECGDTAELILTARPRPVSNGPQNGEVIYANKAMLVGPPGAWEGEGDPDSLHYAVVGFSKGQARAGAPQGEGEIKGMASRTAEYASIRHRSLGEERGEADTVLGQGSQEAEPQESGVQRGSADVHVGVRSTEAHLGVRSMEAQQDHQDSPQGLYGSQLSTQQQSCDGEIMYENICQS